MVAARIKKLIAQGNLDDMRYADDDIDDPYDDQYDDQYEDDYGRED